MVNKVKALIWEECRVGGVIALFSWFIGTLVLVYYWMFDNALLFAQDPTIYMLYVTGLPLLITIMLMLNPDHKGSLQGGFSMRILELPIPTYIPVAISLFARMIFIFLATAMTVTIAQIVFDNALTFIATLVDIRAKRHSASPKQESTNSVPGLKWSGLGFRGHVSATALAFVLISGIWISWPSKPSYITVWKNQGFPTTLAELDEWYQPEGDNHAAEYLELMDTVLVREKTFQTSFGSNQLKYSNFFEKVLIYGAEVKRNEIVPDEIRSSTEKYWNEVTRHVAPQLKEIAAKEDSAARYPIDLLDGHNVNLTHLSNIRNLARQLRVDASHLIWANDTKGAIDSHLAILPISTSLKNEPVLVSGLVRIAILGMFVDGVQDTLNHSDLSESDLERLQMKLQDELNILVGYPILKHQLVGESIINLSAFGLYTTDLFLNSFTAQSAARLPLQQLALPSEADHLVTSLIYQRMFNIFDSKEKNTPLAYFGSPHPPSSESMLNLVPDYEEDEEERFWRNIRYLAPISAILMPAMSRTQETEWRTLTNFEMAIVGLALERYHLVNGNYPASLDTLVPIYLESIPADRYNPIGEALQYRITDEGKGFMVYSFSRNMLDDNGEKKNHSYMDGDSTFKVSPLINLIRDDAYYENN